MNTSFDFNLGTLKKIVRRIPIAKRFAKPEPINYQKLHVNRCRDYFDYKGKKVLVVGCNEGVECKFFIEEGAGEVHGLDVVDEIGQDFQHERVKYIRTSAEDMDIPDNQYDLVYSMATMEHVPNIEPAFHEMARVLKPGGVMYSIAAPLWNSMYGHHKGDIFENYPWIHLLMNADEILQYCKVKQITDPLDRSTMEHHVRYMMNPEYFNMTPASKYVEVGKQLKDVEIIENHLALDEDDKLTPELMEKLASRGYAREEILASVHTLIVRKK